MVHEFDGEKYAEAAVPQREWGSRLIDELGLKGNESVLDLGCGEGSLTALLAAQLPRGSVIGVDASQGMIDAAHPKESANLKFCHTDIVNLEYDSCFDLVFSNAALHWVKDHRRLLQSVKRALRPGGVLRFNFAGHGNCSNFYRVVREAMALPDFASSFVAFEWPWYMPRPDEYLALVSGSGLDEAETWGENADRYFADEEAMIRWIDQPSIVPFLARIHDDLKSRFRDYVVKRMVEETRQADGTCFETFRRINVSGRRPRA